MNLDSMTNGSSSVILLIFLAVAVVTDIHRRRIPNVLVALMLGCGIVLNLSFLGVPGALSVLGGVVVGFLILIPFYALGGLGAGDVKLLVGVGSFLGPWGVLLAGVSTLVLGGVLGIAAIFWQRIGTVMAARSLSIPPSVPIEASAVRIPYSLAIAAGTLVVLYRHGAAMSLMLTN
jgi:prepilin peptidase CpaA